MRTNKISGAFRAGSADLVLRKNVQKKGCIKITAAPFKLFVLQNIRRKYTLLDKIINLNIFIYLI